MSQSVLLSALKLPSKSYQSLVAGKITSIVPSVFLPPRQELCLCETTNSDQVSITHWARVDKTYQINTSSKLLPLIRMLCLDMNDVLQFFDRNQFVWLSHLRVFHLSEPITVKNTDKGHYLPIGSKLLTTDDHPVLDNAQYEHKIQELNNIKPSIDPELEKLALSVIDQYPSFSQLIYAHLNLEPFPSPVIPDWIKDEHIVKLADRSIAEDIEKSNYQAGTDFENITKQALQYLGFTIDKEHKGGAGGLDLFCSAPYPLIGECKAGKTIPNNTVEQIIALGKSNLNNDELFNNACKIVIGAGRPTEYMIKGAKSWKVSIMKATTLQKLVKLQAQYPGCIDLFELRQYLVPAQCDEKIDEYMEKVENSINLRSYIIQVVKNFLQNTNSADATIDVLYGAYSGASDRPQLLTIDEFRDILIELSSPLVGCLGRKSDRFYYLRSLPIWEK